MLILQLKSWLEDGVISVDIDGEKRTFEEIKISPENKYGILRKTSTSVETPKVDTLLFFSKHLKNDENKDLAKKCELSCDAALYSKVNKGLVS